MMISSLKVQLLSDIVKDELKRETDYYFFID